MSGAALVAATNGWFGADQAVACTVAVPLLAVLFVALRRLLPVAAYGAGVLGVATWAVLLFVGWDRALEVSSLGDWWADFRGWPLLAAALLAAVPVHAAEGARASCDRVAAGLSLLALVVLVDAPTTPDTATRDLVVGSCVLVALGLIAAFATRAWALGAAVLAGIGVLGLGLMLTVAPWDALARLGTDGSQRIDITLLARGHRGRCLDRRPGRRRDRRDDGPAGAHGPGA